MVDKNIYIKYVFYIVLAISITATLIVSMILVFNKNNTQNQEVVNTSNSNSTTTSPVSDETFSAKSAQSINPNIEFAPTFATTYKKSTGEFEIICQVKKNLGCDLYTNNGNQKTLLRKYEEANIESVESEPIKNVKWGFSVSKWSYGSTVVLVAIDENGKNVIESNSMSIINVLGISGN